LTKRATRRTQNAAFTCDPSHLQPVFPTFRPDRGKGYEGIVNPLIRPEARLDGAIIGKCIKGEKITLPVAPGRYVLSTTSESPNDFAVTVGEGETVCVRCTISFGVIVPNFKLSRDEPGKCASVIKRMRPQGG
jgi:hypothetical protein